MTSTAAAIFVLRNGAVFSADMVTLPFEIVSMTGGTEWGVLGPGPGNVAADGIAVAAGTTRVIAMIARVVPVGIMTENGRRPAVRRMTYIALLGCGQMRGHRVYLTGCGIAIMAGIAVVGTAGVMRPGAAGEGCRGMAEIAVQTGGYMRGNRVCLTCCGITVMAGLAAIGDAGVIEGRRDETSGIVTDATILGGRDVARIFRCGETSTVTRRAVIDDACMVEGSRLESGGLVAVDAVAVGRYVVVVFTRGSSAVVTGDTVVGDVLVIKRGLGKRRRRMAHRAILGADRNMRRIGLGGGAGCNNAVMA